MWVFVVWDDLFDYWTREVIVWWVRFTHLHSDVLVNGVGIGCALACFAEALLSRSAFSLITMFAAIGGLVVPRGQRVPHLLARALRAGFALVSLGMGCGLVLTASMVGESVWTAVLWFVGQMLLICLWYLVAIPPLEPPPSKRRVAEPA